MTTNPPDRPEDDTQQQWAETRERVKAARKHLNDLAEQAAIERAEFHVWFQEQLEILRQGLRSKGF